ncbi:MAG: DNA translocase FtsK 4TM domain-containing protein [Candidatus Kerfeldbacteria bacterium]|nr:DNA translocase FtsK 4TM domain-containing protein [Candidatus Kerfeldbacteria bacterium]
MPRVNSDEPRKIRRRTSEDQPQHTLNEATRHGILAVALFVVAGVSLLSFFGLAGPLGLQIDNLEGVLLGWIRYLFPVALILYGAAVLMRRAGILQLTTSIGVLLLALGLTGVTHLFVGKDQALLAASAGRGGGYLGYAVAWPLESVTGVPAASIILFALLIIGVLVTFNTSLQTVAGQRSWFARLTSITAGFFGRFRRDERQDEMQEPLIREFEERHVSEDAKEPHQQVLVERPAPDTDLASYELRPAKITRAKTDLPLNLLEDASGKPTSGDVNMNSERIRQTLANFGIAVEMGEIHVGPTVTQYTMKPADGVRIAQIATLANDLALALAAHPIRIEAPIPGKSLVGVEVPNKATALVTLKEILASDVFRRKKSQLTIALGKDVAGQPVVARLDSMPHLLIAGATGSGKSVCINTLLISLLYQNQPKDLKLILVDPKRVELTAYNDIPHLITPVITEVQKTVNALKWAVAEMDRRFRLLQEAGARNVAAFNSQPIAEKLPYIVIIIDELADLMAASANEVEGAIVRLAQMARAVGMHLIVATQRPSVDVITGLIKANVTSRIAFSVASVVDSRTIIDTSGAEKLLGNGDMLYVSAELTKPRRLQGAFVSDKEIERVVDHLRGQASPEYEASVVARASSSSAGDGGDAGSSEDDLYNEAKEVIIRAGKASASLLQRRLRVGYARAARLLDILEENGVIGPLDGAKPREVLVRGSRDGLADDADFSEVSTDGEVEDSAEDTRGESQAVSEEREQDRP